MANRRGRSWKAASICCSLETMQDLLELKAAIAGIRRRVRRAACARVPIQAQPTLITEGRMLLGTDIRAICAVLGALPST